MERKSKTIARAIKATTKRLQFGKDFQYVVERPRKAKVCFGSSQPREKKPNTTRLAVKYHIHTQENLYPGKYFSPSTLLTNSPTSTRGTVIGGRTAAREPPVPESQAPPPNKYTISPPSSPRAPPFGGPPRFKNICKGCTVGPGYYNYTCSAKRSMAFTHTFGGYKKLVPAIKMKCRAVNPDTCEACKETPVGDYWALTPQITWKEAMEGINVDTSQTFFCRACYERERRHPKFIKREDVPRFKKVRGCSQVHFHDGCEAKIFLVPPRDIEKIQEREAYLSLYFR